MLFLVYAAVYFKSYDITHVEKHLDASSSRMKGLTSGEKKREASFKSSYQICTVINAGIKYIGSHMSPKDLAHLSSIDRVEFWFLV